MDGREWMRRHCGRPALLVSVAVLALLAFYYFARADTIGVYSPGRGWTAMTASPLPAMVHFSISALLLGVLPLALARWFTGLSLKELGLGFGNWRGGLLILAIGVPAGVLAGKIASASPAMQAVYPLDPALTLSGFLPHALLGFLYFGAWEVLFRGVLLFGLKDSVGAGSANVLQTALSVVAHFGRPVTETFAALPAGLVFGWVDLRVGSIWYVAIVHWVVATSMDYFILIG